MKKQKHAPALTEQERVKRLEWICLALGITSLILVGLFVRLLFTFGNIVDVLDIVTERIEFISQQVNGIYSTIGH